VRRYVEELKARHIRAERVYLFGSYVSGLATDDSDIDVAVVSEDLTGDCIEDRVRLMRCRWDVDLRIEPHPFRPEDFNDDNILAAEVLRTGIRVA